jgi:hypothetical protein
MSVKKIKNIFIEKIGKQHLKNALGERLMDSTMTFQYLKEATQKFAFNTCEFFHSSRFLHARAHQVQEERGRGAAGPPSGEDCPGACPVSKKGGQESLYMCLTESIL